MLSRDKQGIREIIQQITIRALLFLVEGDKDEEESEIRDGDVPRMDLKWLSEEYRGDYWNNK